MAHLSTLRSRLFKTEFFLRHLDRIRVQAVRGSARRGDPTGAAHAVEKPTYTPSAAPLTGGILTSADGVFNIGGATDKLRMSLLLPLPP